MDDYMTVPRLKAMADYWKKHPPLHLMVAAYFGIGNEEKKGSLKDLIQDFEAIGGKLRAS